MNKAEHRRETEYRNQKQAMMKRNEELTSTHFPPKKEKIFEQIHG